MTLKLSLGTLVGALILVVASSAAAAPEKVLSVEFPKVGDVCLDGDDLSALRKQLQKLVVPAGSAVTLVSFSDQTEATRKRPGLTSDCIAHLVPEGIKSHQRIAVFRALQVAELGQELGIEAFDAAPLLVIGSESYRQVDPDGLAIVSARAEGDSPSDRRVEVWVAAGRSTGGPAAGVGTVILTPILLPPSNYAAGRPTYAPSSRGGAAPGAAVDGSGQETWGWVCVGLGLVSFVGSGFSFAQAADKTDRSREVEFDTERAIALQDDANLLQQLGGWTAGLGVGLTTLGVILVATAADAPEAAASLDTDRSATRTQFYALPGGGAVSVGVDF
jgi:hypothetical protein